jgi:hypothetical protein
MPWFSDTRFFSFLFHIFQFLIIHTSSRHQVRVCVSWTLMEYQFLLPMASPTAVDLISHASWFIAKASFQALFWNMKAHCTALPGMKHKKKHKRFVLFWSAGPLRGFKVHQLIVFEYIHPRISPCSILMVPWWFLPFWDMHTAAGRHFFFSSSGNRNKRLTHFRFRLPVQVPRTHTLQACGWMELAMSQTASARRKSSPGIAPGGDWWPEREREKNQLKPVPLLRCLS